MSDDVRPGETDSLHPGVDPGHGVSQVKTVVSEPTESGEIDQKHLIMTGERRHAATPPAAGSRQPVKENERLWGAARFVHNRLTVDPNLLLKRSVLRTSHGCFLPIPLGRCPHD